MALTGQHFHVVYTIEAETEDEARNVAKKIAHEQTVELPEDLVAERYPEIAQNVVGKLVKVCQVEDQSNHWKLTIAYHQDTTGKELNQFLNVVFGNTSIKPRVQVTDIELNEELAEAFPGPRFGSKGLRELIGIAEGETMVMTALKPMGLSVDALAEQCYAFAKGGIDVIKDDHGLANQPWAPFELRVRACADAVKRANAETGKNCLYAPTLTGPIEKLFDAAKFVKRVGAGAVLMLPGISGFDTIRALAADDSFGLPIIAHPALLGGMLGGSLTPGCLHGFAHDVILALIPQIAGADATIFPNFGGRFGFTVGECKSIVERCRSTLGPYKAISPTPGGGMTLDRIPDILDCLGKDLIMLVGGSVFAHSPDLEVNAKTFVASTGRKEVALNGNGHVNAPSESCDANKVSMRPTKYPPIEGNHGKFFEFKRGFTGNGIMGDAESSHWRKIALEMYKPPTDGTWKGINRTELIGKRGETPNFHVRYFEVSPGGYTTLERHIHEHVVVCIKGEGECIVNRRTWQMGFGDVCYTGPNDIHQFMCPEDKSDTFGFLCIVNSERDRPKPVNTDDPEICGVCH